ncbi:MAG TPA: alpha/beta fold hydrolase [Gemmatimonadaceae bacterium]|nr:alpha/beta fold hydrolase [Gemmatimonadaceae bacterium]
MRLRLSLAMALLCIVAQGASSQGTLTWQPFRLAYGRDTIDAELATLAARENHAEPNGPKVQLAVVRVAGTDRTRPPTIYLDGGPGSSAIAIARIPYFAELFTRIRSIGDVILMDQRGVGRSRPNLACPPAGPPPADMFETEAKFRRYLLEGARACAQRHRANGVRLEHYTTQASADDVAAVVRALGVPRVNLVGFSYGTHLALATIRRHPDLLARVAITGVEGPDHSEKLPSVMDVQLERLAAYARSDSSIGALVPDLVGTYKQVLEKLEREPARVTLNDPNTRHPTQVTVGKFGFQYILFRDLGDSNDWPVLPGLIALTARGDYSLLTAFAGRRWSSAVSAMTVAMDCASGGSPERVAQVEREARTALFGNAMNFFTGEICKAVGAADLGPAYRSRIWSNVPTMFISGTLDSQTPPHQAEEVRWGFPNSVHVVVENAGHESSLDKAAVQQLLVRFLSGEAVQDQRIVLPRPRFRASP